MSRYDDERFLLWFTRPTPTWLELSAAARGVAISVAMELNPRTGELTLRKGLASLATLLRLPWEVVEPAVAELIAAGKLEWDGARFALRDPEFADRRRKSSADRMRDKRTRDRTPSQPPPSDACDASDVTPVTDTPGDAGDVTSSLVLSDLKIGSPPEEIPSARATDPDRPAWFDAVCDTVEFQLPGEKIDRPLCWLRYHGHRTAPESRKAMSKADLQYWLTAVDIPEARKARRAAERERERDAKFDKQRAIAAEPAPAPYHQTAPRPKREKRLEPQQASAAIGDLMAALNNKREAS